MLTYAPPYLLIPQLDQRPSLSSSPSIQKRSMLFSHTSQKVNSVSLIVEIDSMWGVWFVEIPLTQGFDFVIVSVDILSTFLSETFSLSYFVSLTQIPRKVKSIIGQFAHFLCDIPHTKFGHNGQGSGNDVRFVHIVLWCRSPTTRRVRTWLFGFCLIGYHH